MSMLTLLHRNIKWRFNNRFTIVFTILQPILWLILYSTVAGQTMQGIGIQNYTAFIMPGLVVLVSFGACSSSDIMNYLMKADGSFYRILIAPVKRSSIVLGQMLETVLCTFLEVIIMFLMGVIFGVNIASGGLAIAVNLNPFTHVINALKDLAYQGNIASKDILSVFFLLSIMCFISLKWASKRLRKETSL